MPRAGYIITDKFHLGKLFFVCMGHKFCRERKREKKAGGESLFPLQPFAFALTGRNRESSLSKLKYIGNNILPKCFNGHSVHGFRMDPVMPDKTPQHFSERPFFSVASVENSVIQKIITCFQQFKSPHTVSSSDCSPQEFCFHSAIWNIIHNCSRKFYTPGEIPVLKNSFSRP